MRSVPRNEFFSSRVRLSRSTPKVIIADGTASQASWASLFPNDPAIGAVAQNSADAKTNIPGVTIGQYFATQPNTIATGQYKGNVVYINSTFNNYGDAIQMLTIFHEALHIEGFGDTQIETAFGISKSVVDAQGSMSITYKLLGECGLQ